MLDRLHLVRHGEVHNPGHVVYADLPGFPLSVTGREEAQAAAAYLASFPVSAIFSSPLDRAVETAGAIADSTRIPVVTDDRLIEWRLGMRWAGTVWEDLPEAFPGEVEAYLANPHDLPFSPESIAQVADRIRDLVDEIGRRRIGGEIVLVSHQDPIQAARLHLTGRSLTDLPVDKPVHCEVITIEPGAPWAETATWRPAAGHPFPPVG